MHVNFGLLVCMRVMLDMIALGVHRLMLRWVLFVFSMCCRVLYGLRL